MQFLPGRHRRLRDGHGTGPVEGGDAWACAPGSSLPCTPQEPSASTFNTATPASDPWYLLVLGAVLLICRNFLAGRSVPARHHDPVHRRGRRASGRRQSGRWWLDILPDCKPSAAYPIGDRRPIQLGEQFHGQRELHRERGDLSPWATIQCYASQPHNGFVAAPIYSVTYGITPASSPLPDTTYPVPGDLTTWNTYTNPSFGNPLCNVSGTTPTSFDPTVSDSLSFRLPLPYQTACTTCTTSRRIAPSLKG